MESTVAALLVLPTKTDAHLVLLLMLLQEVELVRLLLALALYNLWHPLVRSGVLHCFVTDYFLPPVV